MKGKVGVFARSGRLYYRLPRFLFGGQQKKLAAELWDSPENRRIAEDIAIEMSSDIAKRKFDFTMLRYRPSRYWLPSPKPCQASQYSIKELWQKYFDFKSKMWAPSTIRGNGRFTKLVNDCPYQYLSQAKQVRGYFFGKLTLDGCKRIFKELAACIDWAIDEELIDSENPFRRFIRQLKVPKNPNINPFSKKEKELIIEAFGCHPDHKRYLPFVLFLFKTGCRPSEAVGLRWGGIDPELENIRFHEAVVEGKRKNSTKTYKARSFPINDSLRELLAGIRPNPVKPDLPVFRLPGGELINLGNFLERAWTPLLETLDVAYRVPYNCRHSFITACLKAGIPVTTVAQWVGNTPQTIWANYAGFIDGFDVPDL